MPNFWVVYSKIQLGQCHTLDVVVVGKLWEGRRCGWWKRTTDERYEPYRTHVVGVLAAVSAPFDPHQPLLRRVRRKNTVLNIAQRARTAGGN